MVTSHMCSYHEGIDTYKHRLPALLRRSTTQAVEGLHAGHAYQLELRSFQPGSVLRLSLHAGEGLDGSNNQASAPPIQLGE